MGDMFLGRDAKGGKAYELATEKLRTHGVVVGMTGSGKTGMALVMLEELVAAGVPILAIDPKGDLGNLGLVFPDLAPADFQPWAEGADTGEIATRWKKGLADWGLTDRAQALRDKMAITLYTPGSEAGVPVDVLGTLRRPDDKLMDDDEGRLALISDTVSGLLGLVGHQGDPVRDPAHIVLSTIMDAAWKDGEDPDLELLLTRLVDPPFKKVGVFPVDKFFPPKDRMELAMKLNGVIASPTFQAWTKGINLDLNALLKPGARTPVSVFCIAHLSDDERQFFLSLLLGRLLAWTRSQPGTERLRAVLFFDEVAGYLPPHPKDPPTKRPLLLLMKQARAMGLGVVLATQNPVDVDYKGLSNAGLWVVGRLRTQQDRERVLQGVSGEGLDEAIAGLEKRQFLFALASGETNVVQTRQAMCWLRGPFTKSEIAQFKATDLHTNPAGAPPARKAKVAVVEEVEEEEEVAVEEAAPRRRSTTIIDEGDAEPVQAAPVRAAPMRSGRAPVADDPAEADAYNAPPPVELPMLYLDPNAVFAARLKGTFVPYAEPPSRDGRLMYRPALVAGMQLRFDEEKAGFIRDVEVTRLWFPLVDGLPRDSHDLELGEDDLRAEPLAAGQFAPLPTWIDEKKELAAIQKRVLDEVYARETTGTFVCPGLGMWARDDEDVAAFRKRCEAEVNERVDDAVGALRDTYEAKGDKLQEKIRKAEQKLNEAERMASSRQTEEVLNVGETLLSWFVGRKKSVTTAATKRRQTSAANDKVSAATDDLETLKAEVEELERELVEEMEAVREKQVEALETIEAREIGLEKSDVTVKWFGIVWVPVTRRI